MNPFKYGETVTGDAFLGRKEQVEELQGHLRSGQNVVLFGERRVGKTSLAKEAYRALGKNYDLVIIDINNIKSTQELVEVMGASCAMLTGLSRPKEMARSLLGTVKGAVPTIPMPRPDGSLSAPFEFTGPNYQVDDIFNAIARSHKERPLVVLFDEFQGILGCEDTERVQALLRSFIQHQPDVPYIFAGSIRSEMYKIFMDPGAPFFKSALPMEVGPIDRQEICDSIRRIFKDKNGSSVEDGVLEFAYDMVSGVTGDLSQLCSMMWGLLSQHERVTFDVLERGIERILAACHRNYEALLRPLTEKQARVLYALAILGGEKPLSHKFQKHTNLPPTTIQGAIERLRSNQIIFQPYNKGEHRFYDPFFLVWLAHRKLGQAVTS